MSAPSAPRGFRPVPLVLGSAVALVAVAVLLAGAIALWAHETQRDADGYLTTPTELLTTPTHALVSETAQIDVGTPAWFFAPERFGTIRVHAQGPHGLPIFVGIAPASEAQGYLAEVGYDEVTDLDYGPFSVAYARHEGGAPASAPAQETFWVASAQGSGEQVLTWRLAAGDWQIVALNPDGSAGVEAYVRFGARVAFLSAVAWILLGVGSALLLLGAALIYTGARATPPAAHGAAGPAVAAASGPSTTRPAPERELAGVGADREERP